MNFEELMLTALCGCFGASQSEDKSKFKEIFKLKEMLEKENIPFNFKEMIPQNGYQIEYFGHGQEERVCDIIENSMSYGHEDDKLELGGDLFTQEEEDSGEWVVGYLTAEDIFNRIKTHWNATK